MKEYDLQQSTYGNFTNEVERIIKELLVEANLLKRVHSVTSRVKSKDSLLNKLTSAGTKNSKLGDVTDLSGVRIITYFADDVDTIATIIEKEFDVDRENSVDKRALMEPDRFGYLSLHYVVKLSQARLRLTEYKRFMDFKAEIQIRSILQHAWAEIEHDIGYKHEQSVPKEIRRRFSRLAGLLELTDSEFMQIRDSLSEYERKLPERISEDSSLVLIDKVSLMTFVRNDNYVRKLDQKIADLTKAHIVTNERFIEDLVRYLHQVGFQTIGDIDSSLREFGDIISRFVELFITKKYDMLDAGICLFHLCYAKVAKTGSFENVLNYLKANNIGVLEDQTSIAKNIVALFKKAGLPMQ